MKKQITMKLLKLNLIIFLGLLLGLLIAFTNNNVTFIEILKFVVFTFVVANIGFVIGIYFNNKDTFS